MNVRCFRLIASAILCLTGTVSAHAHTGPHNNPRCFIQTDSVQLRLNGFQFQGRHPGKHYCHFFPLLGDVLISIDSMQDSGNKKISLQWLQFSRLSGLLSGSSANLLEVVHTTPWKPLGKTVNSIEQSIGNRGLYALNIRLKDADNKIHQQRFYILVGFPVTLILVIIAFILLLFIILFFFKHRKNPAAGKPE